MDKELKKSIMKEFNAQLRMKRDAQRTYDRMSGFLAALHEVGIITMEEWDEAITDLLDWKRAVE